MSLKTFHVVFVTMATALMLGFAVWCFSQYGIRQEQSYLLGAGLSAVAAVALVVYGVTFLRKLRNLGSL